MSCSQIAHRLEFTPQRTHYHLKNLIKKDLLVKINIGGRVTQDSIKYRAKSHIAEKDTPAVKVKPVKVKKVKPDEPLLTLEELMAQEAKRDNYRPAGAMANVSYETIRDSSKLVHADREYALRRQRIGCGISQVYEG